MPYHLDVKRRLTTLALFLLLGAAINVAVAWWCCMGAYRNPNGDDSRRRPPNISELAWWKFSAPAGMQPPNEMWPTDVLGYSQTRLIGPGPIITRKTGERIEYTSSSSWNQAGLPMHSMRGEWFAVPDSTTGGYQYESRGAVELPPTTLSGMFPKRSPYLPLRPVWPGFAVNTIFYAMVFFGILAMLSAMRRRRRLRRGLCPMCEYPIGISAACSECGAALPRHSPATK